MVRNMNGLFSTVNDMINNGIKSVAIIQSPDWNGGHDMGLYFDPDPEKDWFEGLGDFCYVEWSGRPIDLLKDMPRLNSHKEPFHEAPVDNEWEWWEDDAVWNLPCYTSDPEQEPGPEPQYVSYFHTDTWCGIVRNVMNVGGKLRRHSWEEIALLLEKYYGEKVSMQYGDTCYLWQGAPDSWASSLPEPTTEEWWQGRLSLEECLITPENGCDDLSGRQPRMLHKGQKTVFHPRRRPINSDPIKAAISNALTALPKRVERKYVVIESTGGSPSGCATYESEFSSRREAEKYRNNFEAEQEAWESSFRDSWHGSAIEKRVTHWYTLPDGSELNFRAIMREIEKGRLHGLTLSF